MIRSGRTQLGKYKRLHTHTIRSTQQTSEYPPKSAQQIFGGLGSDLTEVPSPTIANGVPSSCGSLLVQSLEVDKDIRESRFRSVASPYHRIPIPSHPNTIASQYHCIPIPSHPHTIASTTGAYLTVVTFAGAFCFAFVLALPRFRRSAVARLTTYGVTDYHTTPQKRL